MIPFCQFWSSEGVQWNKGNWTWAECELIQEICQTWGTTQFPWFLANWKWSECSSSVPSGPCAVWSTTKIPWAQANWKWSECSGSQPIPPIPVVSVGNQPGVDANTLIPPWIEEPWNPYRAADREQAEKKRKRLIKLILKVKGQQYDEEKEVKDFDVTVGDIKMVVKAATNIDLKVKE